MSLTTSLELLLTTAFIALASAVLATAFGVVFGRWLRTLSSSIGRVVSAIALIPFLLPPLLIGMAFSQLDFLYSSFGILNILVAHTIMNFGFIGRVVASSTLQKEQIEEARISGANDFEIFARIELPQLRGPLSSAGLLVAIYSATSYGLILILGNGVRTLETEIARTTLVALDFQTATLLAVLQSFLTLALFLLARRFGPGVSLLGQLERQNLRVGLLSKILGYALLALVVITIGTVMARSFSGVGLIDNLENLFSTGYRSILNISPFEAGLNSIRNALITATLAVVIALFLASRKYRSGWVLIAVGISPVVIGLATLIISGYLPRELTASWLLLPLVQVLLSLPIAYQILRPAFEAIDTDVRFAAHLDGANQLTRLLRIEAPQVSRSIGLAAAFAALVSLGEFGTASFLAFGENETLPIVMFKLLSRPGEQNLGMAMTAAAIHILIAACITWISLRSGDMKSEPDRAER
ncbi:iron ABC transporter permease [Aquiluna borgnonia]|uniref:Iron ABC transporter permease n=1 Tax=Aquiluna borgnonia TaxID=2499157 RepID=A0A7D4PZR3_9MICO|nr:ABC transporter permease subunit [Aquiluna borgnonia]QKJ25845.1 iron ABC transporter permease [Aquiluna borgnonia]